MIFYRGLGRGVANGEVDEDEILIVFWRALDFSVDAKLELDDVFMIIRSYVW